MKTLCYLTLAVTLIIVLVAIWSPVYKDELVASSILFTFLSAIAISVLSGEGFTDIDDKQYK